MAAEAFPNPNHFDFPAAFQLGNYIVRVPGVIAFGVEPTTENLREAYRKGIFPWPTDGFPLPWHCPDMRAILEFNELHISKSLEKTRRSTRLSFTIDRDFRAVIKNCSHTKRPDQTGTWITTELMDAFCGLHKAGMAHSVEAWDAEGRLAGGLYGVDAGGVFCGESMFYRHPNSSKLALLFLIDHLKQRGSTWLDAQVMTPHIKALGAKEIGRNEFLKKLNKTQARSLNLFGQRHDPN